MTQELSPLQEIAHENDAAIILIDHHRKNKNFNRDVVTDISGSTAKSAMADTVWGLYRERGKKEANLAITGRDVDERTLKISMAWDIGTWQLESDQFGRKVTPAKQEILDLLIEKQEPIQEKAIVEATGRDKGNINRQLKEMVALGLITHSKEDHKNYYQTKSNIE